MKRIIALAMVLLPLLAVGQNTNLTAQQSAKRIAQLSKIMQQYDTRYTTDFELHIDCGLAIFSNDDYQQGIIDLNGKILLPAQYHIYRQYIDQKATSLFLVVSDDKMGLIDKNMRWVLPMEYDHKIDCLECLNMYSWFSHGYSCMHKNGKYGAVDTAGRVIIPFKFYRGFGIDMEHRMLRFSDYDEDGSINEWITDYEGNLLIGPYESIQNFSEGLASFWVNDKMGFLDLKGRVVVPNRYDCCGGYGFHNGYAMVKENNTYMLIDKKGNIAQTLTNLSKFNIDDWLWDNSVFIISKHTNDASSNNYEYGAVDRSGKIVIQPRYRRWYVINDQYLAMTNYNDEMQCSMVDIYDKEGNLTAQFPQFIGEEYDETYFYYSQYFPAGKDALWGLVDSKFQEVLPFRYKEVTWLGYQYVRVVTTDDQTKIIDFSGKEVVSGPYELIEVVGDGLFKFYASNPDNIDELIVGYIDLYGNTTATQAQIDKMNAWMKRR